MTSRYDDGDDEVNATETREYAKEPVEFSGRHDSAFEDDGEDGGSADTHCEGENAGEDPSSYVDSERTNSTTTTAFSASSLPSLGGIDSVAATRPSFSSLPPADGDNDEHTMKPYTVVTADDRHYDADAESPARVVPTDPVPITNAKPLPASPRLPRVTYDRHTMLQSNPDFSPPCVLSGKRSAAAAVGTSSVAAVVLSDHTTLTAGDVSPTEPKRVRREGLGTTQRQPIISMSEHTTVEVLDAAFTGSSSPHRDATTTKTSDATTTTGQNLQYVSKHDEKWLVMLEQLKEYQRVHGNTEVPQTFPENMRLGRWVHYQRVEYWAFQEKGKAKINEQRIKMLDDIGFEWDPQFRQWQAMLRRLGQFVTLHGHAKVPKGFSQDLELANWVRNQRLEYRKWEQHKKSRMTQYRIEALNKMGFVWSQSSTSASMKANNAPDSERKCHNNKRSETQCKNASEPQADTDGVSCHM